MNEMHGFNKDVLLAVCVVPRFLFAVAQSQAHVSEIQLFQSFGHLD